MPTVWIPAMLRHLTDDQESVAVAGQTLREVIDALESKFPGINARLCDVDNIRAGLNVVIDGQIARGGLAEAVGDTSEVHFISAIAGGQSRKPQMDHR
jgi:molybdopterin synthase sulfur carrier subunit